MVTAGLAVDAVSATLPLHGGTTVVGPHVLVLVVAVVGLWVLVAGLVAAVDRLLARVDGGSVRPRLRTDRSHAPSYRTERPGSED